MDTQPHGAWYDTLDPRQKATIDHALSYQYNYSHAGVPGHSAHLLIAKLVELLDDATEKQLKPKITQVTWDEANQVWRNAETGVQVDHSLLRQAAVPAVDLTRAPDTSKKPKGFA